MEGDVEGALTVPLMSDHEVADLLANTHYIAVVGVPNDPASDSYRVAAYQQSQGYHLLPVAPQEDSILGFSTANSVSDLSDVDIVDVFAHPNDVPAIADEAIRAGAKALWLQPGSSNPQAVQRAEQAGLKVIDGKCFMREHSRLMADKPM